jgi:hypothetical protein
VKIEKHEDRVIYSLGCMTHAMWSAVLCGNPSDTQKKIYEYMKNVKVGDFVMEHTTFGKAQKEWEYKKTVVHLMQMIGEVVEICREEIEIDDEGRRDYADGGEDVPTEQIYYIENLHGIRFRWHNASFVRILDESHWGPITYIEPNNHWK